MKSRIICVLLVLALSISIAACSNEQSTLAPNSTDIPVISPSANAPSAVPTVEPTDDNTDNSVSEAYKAVLSNNATFFSVENGKDLLLNDFLTNQELYGAAFTASRFAMLDLDGDGVIEVILELTVNDSPEFYEILHFTDGKVYGYNIVYRGLEQLKADGTFYYSNGAADGGYGKLKFQPDAYDTDILAHMESSQNGDELTIAYFVDSESVSEEAFQSFRAAQDGKSDAIWYEFTKEQIEAELS